MKTTTILVADDDPQMLRLIAMNLQLEGYAVLTATNGQDALDLISDQSPALALLDVMMPRLDGFSVTQQVRGFSAMPIIIITARGNDPDKVRGLDLGADDYLTKPISVDELLARVRAVLRRADHNNAMLSEDAPMTIGDVTVDFAQHSVSRAGAPIDLTPTEYHLLAYLVQNAGRVLTQNMLLEHVWGAEYVGEHHMLQVNINRLRRKLEADPAHPRYIQTKSSFGYFFARPFAPTGT